MQWKSVQEYNGCYEVSDTGLVRSVDRIVPDARLGYKRVRGRMMKLTTNSDGYQVVSLHKDGVSNVMFVHRLVAEAFLPNIYNLPVVNHKDGNKQNNDISNLEWATYAENNNHALETNLRQPRGNMIAMVTESGYVIEVYRSACEAARETGISRGMISHCLCGRAKTAGGYCWVRFEECNDYSFDGSSIDDEFLYEVQEQLFAEDIVCAAGNSGFW